MGGRGARLRDRERYVESLELIRSLEFDVLVPWATTAGRRSYDVVDRPEIDRRISAILERVRRGGQG